MSIACLKNYFRNLYAPLTGPAVDSSLRMNSDFIAYFVESFF